MSLELGVTEQTVRNHEVSISFGDLMSLEQCHLHLGLSPVNVSISFGDLMSLERSWKNNRQLWTPTFQSPLEI